MFFQIQGKEQEHNMEELAEIQRIIKGYMLPGLDKVGWRHTNRMSSVYGSAPAINHVKIEKNERIQG